MDAAAFESERLAREPDFKAESESLPRMPSAPGEPEDKAWIDAAREFLLTGEGAHSGAEPTLAEPLLPVVLDAL
ncbi:MAG: hypothetical protein GTO30_11480, partial [Acidobacteria bacterium]|nr:hypothetical protein [Acidobacteriota bacterium]NIQ83380.1 hypothetical protein [Acidobacteriota bacterium]